jgi:general secretion pathway protein G
MQPRLRPDSCRTRPRGKPGPCPRGGFTLIELLIVVAIAAVLVSIALPYFAQAKDKENVRTAINDIKQIELAIAKFEASNARLPDSLAEVGMDGLRDPWGHPYAYLPFDADTQKSDKRKDKNLNPVNSDYDLYSAGKDGDSQRNFTAQNSRDDVVRGRNGGFVGLAAEF